MDKIITHIMHAADKLQKKNSWSVEMVTTIQGRDGFIRTLDFGKYPIWQTLLQQSETHAATKSFSTRNT